MRHPPVTMAEKMQGKLRYPGVLVADLLNCIKMSDNWWDIVFFKVKIIGNFELKLRDGRTVAIKNRDEYAKVFPPLIFDYKFQMFIKSHPQLHVKINDHTVNIGRATLGYSTSEDLTNLMVLIREVFLEKAYSWLDFKNKTVVDVGANIGDTAVYFALNGAKKVYSLEPYPYSFDLLKRNLDMNNITSRKVVPINAGIGAKDGSVVIERTYKNTGSDDMKKFKRGKEIPIICFETLLKTYNLDDAVLKMDCEGGEYPSIFHSSKETLRKFSRIQMEYHYGYKELVRYLERCGFRVRHTIPRCAPNQRAADRDMYIGYIYAERI
jgi:FkbM family methyltransferase